MVNETIFIFSYVYLINTSKKTRLRSKLTAQKRFRRVATAYKNEKVQASYFLIIINNTTFGSIFFKWPLIFEYNC